LGISVRAIKKPAVPAKRDAGIFPHQCAGTQNQAVKPSSATKELLYYFCAIRKATLFKFPRGPRLMHRNKAAIHQGWLDAARKPK
jgi:hypothetical protein